MKFNLIALALLLLSCEQRMRDIASRPDASTPTDIPSMEDNTATIARCISLQIENMQVLYVGVENKITLSDNGVPTDEVELTSENAEISSSGNGIFSVTVSRPGTTQITISGEGIATRTQEFVVKSVPNPTPKLGSRNNSGEINSGEMRVQGAITASLEDFEYETRFDIRGFIVRYVARNQSPVEITNLGGRFSEDVQSLIANAQSGDFISFLDIRCSLAGENIVRKIGSLTFKVR